MSDLERKLKGALTALGLKDAQIDVQGVDRSIIATVVSSSFHGMEEAERQRLVWQALRENLSEGERATVEFVFTIAPGEGDAAEQAI